jgi:Fic/DOC family
MLTAATRLDAAITAGNPPASGPELAAVIEFAALAQGEWVRIHPFANGNGRTARCWTNFVALRYGLPAFVTIKPRPADLVYAQAAHASMAGDHVPTESLFAGMPNSPSARRSPGPQLLSGERHDAPRVLPSTRRCD